MGNRLTYLADGQQKESTGPLIDWRDMISVVLERAWIGLAVALAVFLFFWFNTHRQTPYYRSVATLMVDMQVPQMFNFQDVMPFNSRNLEYFNTHVKALHTRPMIAQAIQTAALGDHPDFTPGVEPGPAQVAMASRYITIAPVERSRMMEIVVEHPHPQIAADLANGLASAYIQVDLDSRMEASMQAVQWLRERADEYRANLEAGLLKVQQYREDTRSVSLQEDQDIIIAQLKAINTALTAAQTERIKWETRWTAVRAQMEDDVPLTEVVLLLEDPLVIEAQRRWIEQGRRVDQLRQRYREQHPDLEAALDEERTYLRQFEQAAERAANALRNRYETAVNQEKNLQLALQEQEEKAFELDRKLVRYDELRRNAEADEQVYQAILSRMKETSLSGTLPSEVIRLIEEATPASRHFRPNRPRAMLRGAVMGVVFGLAAIFLLYFADQRFWRTEEIEHKLGLRVVGTLPLINEKSFSDRGLIVHRHDTGEAAEAFRTLRASLLLADETRDKKCWMVTSAHAAEGKSLVATNLAISLAQDHQRTLLIGADLRRPSLHKLFEAPQTAGLAEVLKGEAVWSDVLIGQDVPGLDVLVAGHTPSRPSELLGDKRLKEFLADVRKSYDHIVIDAPPVLGVSDALILLSHADTVLFVVRYGVSHSLSGKHAVKKLEASGTPCGGAIMNGVNYRSVANYYYYRRYGGYAYGNYAAKDEAQSASSGRTEG